MFLGPNYSSVKGSSTQRSSGGHCSLLFWSLFPSGSEQNRRSWRLRRILTQLSSGWSSWQVRRHRSLIDQHEPLASSFYVRGSAVEQELRGKKLSVVSWEENEKMEQWIAKIVEAFGFPRAETK